MFLDEVKVHLIAGRGGNGCVAFRREKYVPRGGPNGGDGGNGGSLIVEADANINTLAEFNTHKVFRAQPGEMGFGKEMAGKNSQDLILKVPIGTMIFDESKKTLLADLKENGEKYLAARGGRGGYGNAHFKTSTRQAPSFAELGEPGEERMCVLELKMVADVGIIGLPSVGKSTLISRISNARPKIAEYHFTTLVPNLGLVTMKQFGGSIQQSFLACDLPGLIEGAHEGKGLGVKFLKHVSRNRVLVHLLDVNSPDPEHDFKVIMNEMKQFDKELMKKPLIVAFNKIDTISKEDLKKLISSFKKKHSKIKKVFAMSSVTGEGIAELMFEVWRMLEQEKEKVMTHKPKPEKEKEFKVFRPDLERSFHAYTIKKLKSVKKGKQLYEVNGGRIGQIVSMTNFDNPEAVARVYDVLQKMSINRELKREGAKFGDEIIIKGHTLIYRWD